MAGWLIRSRNRLLFASTCVHSGYFDRVRIAHLSSFLCACFLFYFCFVFLFFSSSCVLSVQCCYCLWIVVSWLPSRFSLTFMPILLVFCTRVFLFSIPSAFPPHSLFFPPAFYCLSGLRGCTAWLHNTNILSYFNQAKNTVRYKRTTDFMLV